MSELSDESRALIESEGPLDEASPAEIDAMHARVVAALGGLPAAAPAPAPAPEPSSLAGGVASVTALKLAGTALVAALGSSALLFALSSSPPVATPAPRPSALAAPARPAPEPMPEPEPVPAPEAPAPGAASSSPPRVVAPVPKPTRPMPMPSVTSAAAPSASEEALLVAAAEAQLRSGHAAAALALYERHLREYPSGALRHESSTGRIVALCSAGRSAEARAEVTRYAERHPGSAALLRMQRACGFTP